MGVWQPLDQNHLPGCPTFQFVQGIVTVRVHRARHAKEVGVLLYDAPTVIVRSVKAYVTQWTQEIIDWVLNGLLDIQTLPETNRAPHTE